MYINLLSSLFIGSALSKILSNYLVNILNINLFNNYLIPALTEELARGKTYDLFEYVFTLIFIPLCFLFIRKLLSKDTKIKLSLLVFNLIVFLQVFFTSYNLNLVLTIIAFFYFLFLVWSRLKPSHFEYKNNLVLLFNGFLTGLYLALLTSNIVTTVLPLAFVFIFPIIYLSFSKNFSDYLNSHLHLLFAISIIFPNSLGLLLLLGVMIFLAIFKFKSQFNRPNYENNFYPFIFIVLITFNPIYKFGGFDSVEEGFWAGWIQRIRNGEVLYKDVAVYHPPLIIWFLYFFQKLTSFSLENLRLGLHVLQILGVILYYVSIRTIVKKPLSMFVVMLLMISFTTLIIKNNTEIRLGIGLVSLASLVTYFKNQKAPYLFLAGILSSVSVFTSIEVGIAAVLASLLIIFLFSKNKIYDLVKYLSAVLVFALPISFYFILKNGLYDLVNQISFYASAFSSGYFNLEVKKPILTPLIYVHMINQFISGRDIFWEITKWGIAAAGIFTVMQFTNKKATLIDKSAVAFIIFSIIVFRAALGRSDFYHLQFPLLATLPLIYYMFENINVKGNKLLITVSAIFIIVFTRDMVFSIFVQHQILKLQMYGRNTDIVEPFLSKEKLETAEFIEKNTTREEKIFVYPWAPELYFLSNRKNATKVDTPYAFFNEAWQDEMVNSLQANNPKYIIYNPNMSFGNLSVTSLPKLNDFIVNNYEEVESIYQNKILVKKQSY